MARPPKDTAPTPGGIIKALWRMTLVTVFYPLSLGLFFYIWWKGYHWGWGALIVAAIIIFDPIWIIFVRNLLGWKSKKH